MNMNFSAGKKKNEDNEKRVFLLLSKGFFGKEKKALRLQSP